MKFNIQRKFAAATVIQVIFIVLLFVSLFYLKSSLDQTYQAKVEYTQEINKVKEFTLKVKAYFNKNIGLRDLRDHYSSLKRSISNQQALEKTNDIWTQVNEIEDLRTSNQQVETQVMKLSDQSIKASSDFISRMSQKLADPEARQQVSTIERLVIAGANQNNIFYSSVKEYFLKLKEDMSKGQQLLSLLKKGIQNAKRDEKRLANTPYAVLPKRALEANKKIQSLTTNYVNNVNTINELENNIDQNGDDLFGMLNQKDIENTELIFDSMFSTIRNIFILLLVISVALIALNGNIASLIRDFLNQMGGAISKMADGELNINISEKLKQRKDELGEFSVKTEKTLKNFMEVVQNVKNASTHILSAGNQLNSSSQQLSQGASEQASSVQEVSSSMEEMASNIQQNTDNANKTEQITSEASQSMGKMGDAGKKSLTSIREIADKINIINDIAFQTNILALNAAVEAARAGEYGKGFAVVASEVRKLAERSKTAADEIVELANSSVAVTKESDELIDKLVPEMEQVAQLIREINAASQEQNSGANQVNNAIQELNNVTQQNAASSEELATSAQELAGQADQMNEIIGFFKTGVERSAVVSTKDRPENKSTPKSTNTKSEPEEGTKQIKPGNTGKNHNKNGIDSNLKNSRDDEEFEKY